MEREKQMRLAEIRGEAHMGEDARAQLQEKRHRKYQGKKTAGR